ncbi:MAG: hypothetical protein Q7L55_08370 [Actinomycetota bacterium]|nr:hypothetical protein [Actinomycetota bacterium]
MLARRTIGGLALGLMVLSAPISALADTADLARASSTVKKQVFADLSMPWTADQRCTDVALAKSNRKWALVSTSPFGYAHCGPSSGHTQVIKRTASGWKYLFYDMENDGCQRFHVPASVRHDFAPFVC